MHPTALKKGLIDKELFSNHMNFGKIWYVFSVPERYVCYHGSPSEDFFSVKVPDSLTALEDYGCFGVKI